MNMYISETDRDTHIPNQQNNRQATQNKFTQNNIIDDIKEIPRKLKSIPGKVKNAVAPAPTQQIKERITVLNRRYTSSPAPFPNSRDIYVNSYDHDSFRHRDYDYYYDRHRGDYGRHRYTDPTRHLRIKGEIGPTTSVKVLSQEGSHRSVRFPFIVWGVKLGGRDKVQTQVKLDNVNNATLELENEAMANTFIKGNKIHNGSKVKFDVRQHAEGKIKFNEAENYSIDFSLHGKNSKMEFEDRAKSWERRFRLAPHISDKFKFKSKKDEGYALGTINVATQNQYTDGSKSTKVDFTVNSANQSEFKIDNHQKGKQADYSELNLNSSGRNQYEIKGYFTNNIKDNDGKGKYKIELNNKNRGHQLGTVNYDNEVFFTSNGTITDNFSIVKYQDHKIAKKYSKGHAEIKGEDDTTDQVLLNLKGPGRYIKIDGKGNQNKPNDTMALHFGEGSNNYYVQARNYEKVELDLGSTSTSNILEMKGHKSPTELVINMDRDLPDGHTLDHSLNTYFNKRWHQNDALHLRDDFGNEIILDDKVKSLSIKNGFNGPYDITNWFKSEKRFAKSKGNKKFLELHT